jgi:basic membrane protein A
VFAVAVLVGCADEEEPPDDTGATSSDTVGTSAASAVTTAQPTTTEAPDPITVAIVAPSGRDDASFTQSMVDSVERLAEDVPIELAISDGLADIEAARTALVQYATDGTDLVIAHGSQYGAAVREVAGAHPDVTFAWGTADVSDGAPANVHGYTARSDEGGYVNGVLAAQLTTTGKVAVIAPVAVGDAARYVAGLVVGAAAVDPGVQIDATYLDSYTDLGLAHEASATQIAAGADVLSGTAQIVNGARTPVLDAGLPWLATQSSQNALGESVVASQVYHWEVAFADLVAQLSTDGTAGVPPGPLPPLTLANGGLTIEFNEEFPLDDAARAAADEAIAGLTDGSVVTGVP